MAKRKPRAIPALEWVSAIIGFFIALALLGFLAVQAVREAEPLPPALEAVAVSLHRAGGQYIVGVEVRNASPATGAGVQVQGILKQGGSEVEESATTISYVPGNSHRRAGLIFTRDPRAHQLDLRITGYELP